MVLLKPSNVYKSKVNLRNPKHKKKPAKKERFCEKYVFFFRGNHFFKFISKPI